jgi:hypothetical protein
MLKGEAKGRFIDLTEHPGFKDLLVVLETLERAQGEELLRTRLVAGKEAEIAYLKAKAEGAEKMRRDFLTLVKALSKGKA